LINNHLGNQAVMPRPRAGATSLSRKAKFFARGSE
jgi:hypothetical protein